MKEEKRWGKTFVDNRNWIEYNEELVVRGEFMLELDWVKSWDKELEQMNKGKVGAQYEFPESLIRLQAVWHQLIDFRGIEGVTRKLVEVAKLPAFNDYTTINRRVNKTEIGFILPKQGTVSASCDGTGIKMTNGGEYKQTKYGKKKRKFIRVTITADPINKKLLACDACIDGEGLSEQETAQSHIDELTGKGLNIDKFWGDGAFDAKGMFNKLQCHGIESAIKIRENASTKARGSMRRSREVEEYKEKGYKKWAKDKQYGLRWVGTEGIFSAVKRKFGDNARSKAVGNMLRESMRKFWAYDWIQQYAKARV